MAFEITQDLWLDLSSPGSPLVRSLSDPTPIDHLDLTGGDKPTFRIHFIERSGNTAQLVDLAEGVQIKLAATKDGSTLLLLAEDFTAEESWQEGAVDCATEALAAAIAALESYQTHLAARMEVEIQNDGDSRRITLQFDVRFHPQIYDGQDAPTSLPGPDAYVAERAVLYDREQSLTTEQRAAALANLGITITDDEIQVTCPDSTIRRALLSDLA